jgi:hypothetical protein
MRFQTPPGLSGNPETETKALCECVDAFAEAMKAKLTAKISEKIGGWDNPNWTKEDIIAQLKTHIDKGDMIDVANFAMFAWNKLDTSTYHPTPGWKS